MELKVAIVLLALLGIAAVLALDRANLRALEMRDALRRVQVTLAAIEGITTNPSLRAAAQRARRDVQATLTKAERDGTLKRVGLT
jgi:transaldolase